MCREQQQRGLSTEASSADGSSHVVVWEAAEAGRRCCGEMLDARRVQCVEQSRRTTTGERARLYLRGGEGQVWARERCSQESGSPVVQVIPDRCHAANVGA